MHPLESSRSTFVSADGLVFLNLVSVKLVVDVSAGLSVIMEDWSAESRQSTTIGCERGSIS